MTDLAFEDLHTPGNEFGCVLMARLADNSVVKFVIEPKIVADVLEAPNGVIGEQAKKHCEKHRERIEKACRKAYASRSDSRVVLEADDFSD
jgi:hypothetical protein